MDDSTGSSHKRARTDDEMDEHDEGGGHGVEHPPPPKERRFKLSRACDRCRRRRIKCDEGHPCQSCISANSSCTFEESGKRSHPHKSKRTVSLEDRMQHLESLIHAIPSNIFNPSALASSTSPAPHTYPLGVPPASLTTFPGGIANPATHFAHHPTSLQSDISDLADATSKLSLTHSYLYLDDQGSTRWQGESSGLPLLDVLLEEDRQYRHDQLTEDDDDEVPATRAERGPRRDELNPGAVWRAVTAVVPPDLMDTLVQVFLSTSHYLYPFLHVPTFLADYANPYKWGEPGFASFVLAICALASRHTDDPRVRQDPSDPLSAGTHFLELFHRLRSSSGVPGIDRPSLYSIQAALTAAVYCIGLGRLSRGAALLSESITLSLDVGLHRSTDMYDDAWFDTREREARARTFWAVYCWDKQLAAAFGRPPLLRLRDCDVRAPRALNDDFVTAPPGTVNDGEQQGSLPSAAEAFLYVTRIYVVLEGVLESVAPIAGHDDVFLQRAAGVLVGDSHHAGSTASPPSAGAATPDFDIDSGRGRSPDHPSILPQSRQNQHTSPYRGRHPRDDVQPVQATATHLLYAEEHLLDQILGSIPTHWAPSAETLGSPDVLRVTQATRVLCMERFVRMLIHRHRLGVCVAKRAADAQERERTSSQGASAFGLNQPPHSSAAFPFGFGTSALLTRSVAQDLTRSVASGGAVTNGSVSSSSALAEVERDAIRGCHSAAIGLVAAHLSVATKGLMTYYGVHVIHQLTQAGRSLLAVLLECQHFINEAASGTGTTGDSPDSHHASGSQHTEAFYRSLVPPAVDALRSCLGLLRRFSGRYVCGLRSADLIEECCRRTRIPLDANASNGVPGKENELSRSRRPWLRPVKRKMTGRGTSEEKHATSSSSPESAGMGTPPATGSLPIGSYPMSMHQRHTQQPIAPLPQPPPMSNQPLGMQSGRTSTPFLVGTPGVPMPGSGLDVLEYGMMDGGMGLDMGQLDLLAMLDASSYGGGQNSRQQTSPVQMNGLGPFAPFGPPGQESLDGSLGMGMGMGVGVGAGSTFR